MVVNKLFNLVFACSVLFSFSKCECDLSIFTKSEIVPDYIPEIPSNPLKLKYDGQSIDCGCTLSRLTSLTKPDLSYPGKNDTLYTVIMFDPDAPLVGPYCHWLVENIKGNDVKTGQTVTPYVPPFPCPILGDHRYVIVVYEQPGKLNDPHQILGNNFDVKSFIMSHKLQGPIAGNLFYEGGEL